MLGKILGGTSLAWLQGMLFCLLAPLSGIHLTAGTVCGLVVVDVSDRLRRDRPGLSDRLADGLVAGLSRDHERVPDPALAAQRGAVPGLGRPRWLQWVMWCNPLTYCVEAVRAMFYSDVSAVTGGGTPACRSLWRDRCVRGRDVCGLGRLANRRREGVLDGDRVPLPCRQWWHCSQSSGTHRESAWTTSNCRCSTRSLNATGGHPARGRLHFRSPPQVPAHALLMISALVVSAAFLTSYLIYHAARHQATGAGHTTFTGHRPDPTGVLRHPHHARGAGGRDRAAGADDRCTGRPPPLRSPRPHRTM